jgi:hypothetical protein
MRQAGQAAALSQPRPSVPGPSFASGPTLGSTQRQISLFLLGFQNYVTMKHNSYRQYFLKQVLKWLVIVAVHFSDPKDQTSKEQPHFFAIFMKGEHTCSH